MLIVLGFALILIEWSTQYSAIGMGGSNVAHSHGNIDRFADLLANVGRSQSTVVRCYWCGNKKTNPYGMCEACHRFPPNGNPK